MYPQFITSVSPPRVDVPLPPLVPSSIYTHQWWLVVALCWGSHDGHAPTCGSQIERLRLIQSIMIRCVDLRCFGCDPTFTLVPDENHRWWTQGPWVEHERESTAADARGEPTATYRCTSWFWEITSWGSRRQEDYRLIQWGLWNVPQRNKEKKLKDHNA